VNIHVHQVICHRYRITMRKHSSAGAVGNDHTACGTVFLRCSKSRDGEVAVVRVRLYEQLVMRNRIMNIQRVGYR